MEDMSIQDLVSVLRTAFRTEDFDRVEGVLVSRYNRLQTEILDLKEKLELEKQTRFQAEEDLRKREELCERHKDNYETLMKGVKEKTSCLTERDNIGVGELRKKNNALEMEVFELRKRIKDAQGASSSSSGMKKRSEALPVPVITDFEDRDEENIIGEYEIGNGIVEPNPLRSNEPPSKKSKKAEGASSAMTQTRGATVDAAHSRHGNPITSCCRESVARHAPVVEEVIVMGSAVVPPSDAQEQMAIHFISSVHQERYSEFLANKKFVEETNFRFEVGKYTHIEWMIEVRKWEKLTSFAKDASMTLAKEFYANAYQDPAKKDENNKNNLKKFTSFVRGKEVPFHDEIINELFALKNYKQCSFETRTAKGSKIDHQEIRSTLCRDEADWVRNKDETPSKLLTSNLTRNAKAWAIFVLRTLLPCSHRSDLTIRKASLVTAILKGEQVNVGRLLADDLWSTANSSNTSSYIGHASLISKLCERVEVYPENNEEMVKPSGAITPTF